MEGTVVVLDLDDFSRVVAERGWSEYEPNDATARLTELVDQFLRKHQAFLVWGLDEERGTEEAVIEVPFKEPEELEDDLRRIEEEMRSLGVGITIVAVKGFLLLKEAKDRREAYYATPDRRRAKKLLERIKRSKRRST
ncbi:MAG: hypothetical protein GXO07_00515 [Crenarchaeota archaeon]|nr:hypothetical protein [Thermoproteota archaeon]